MAIGYCICKVVVGARAGVPQGARQAVEHEGERMSSRTWWASNGWGSEGRLCRVIQTSIAYGGRELGERGSGHLVRKRLEAEGGSSISSLPEQERCVALLSSEAAL